MRLSPVFLLVVGTTLLRGVFAATTGLGVDESYMVTAGRVVSLGYFDHPPASWWLSWGAAHLFGTEDPLAVRSPFILLFAVSQILVGRISCRIAGPRVGFWAAAAFNLSPVFGVTTASWVLPDGPLDTALLGAVLCLLNALSSDGCRPRLAFIWWVGAGLCAGLGLFSKYSAMLTIGGAVLFFLVDRTYRRWLARPEIYLAAAVALGVFSPVLIWNATHGWASLAFQGDRAAGLRFHPLAPIVTMAGEALFILPWIWLPMMVLFARGFQESAPSARRLLVWLAAPPIAGFALISAWSSHRVLFHWAAPGYLMLFPLLGAALTERLNRAWVRCMIAGSAMLVLAAMAVISTQIQFDWLGSSLAPLFRQDPTQEGTDWTSVRDDLLARGVLQPGSVAAGLSWRDAGKIGYALGPDVTMLCLCTDARQFGLAHPLRDFVGQDVLVLTLDPPERAAREAQLWFGTVRLLPQTPVLLRGRLLLTVTVLQGRDLRPEGLQPGL